MLEYIACTCPECKSQEALDQNYMVITHTIGGNLSLRITDPTTGATASIVLDDNAVAELVDILQSK